ncbi:hypothetical protein [Aquimarina acroporae]|uniref:hypothetical protein n=1 Tax=Aquimarina acroporae TaxID=2937283 RepID=UPI0020BECABB|nr:hypothetical protein [Aquimarina acroporae]
MKDKKLKAITKDDYILRNVSLNYRHMHVDPTNSVRELYSDTRFSTSERHRSYSYINHSNYKPNSNLYLRQILRINEKNRIL